MTDENGLRPLPTTPDQRVRSQEGLVPEICAAGGMEGGGTQWVRLQKNKLLRKSIKKRNSLDLIRHTEE